jgi:hypothetical protein
MSMTRKEFLGTMFGVAGVAVLAGCGGDEEGGDCAMSTADIAANHGHTLTVSAADVTAGVDKTYDIAGSAGHSHNVTITAANFATLKATANASLMVTSTSGGTTPHTHVVTITCA